MFGSLIYPAWQFKGVRASLGLYFAYLFASLTIGADKIFAKGLWLAFESSPSFEAPTWIFTYCLTLMLASFAFLFHRSYRLAAVYMWIGLAVLQTIQPVIFDFDFDYLGWLLLAVALCPTVSWTQTEPCHIPRILYFGAWLVLGLSYTCSGLSKIAFPPWIAGEVVMTVVTQNFHIARFDLPFTTNAFWLGLGKASTWFVLTAETLFLPLCIFRPTRALAWLAMTLVHLGIGTLTILTSLNVAMLIFHLFVFDLRFFRTK